MRYPLDDCIQKLQGQQHLKLEESFTCLNTIFSGKCENKNIVQLLSLLQSKGETVEEVVGFARAMRTNMLRVDLHRPAMDLCGTGGSGKDRFNISTAASFILAAGDVPVAKHGNKGSVKPNGSIDFLQALNIPFDFAKIHIEDIFKLTNLCFLYARQFHPAMRYVSQARAEINKRTIFNLLGPLCNPADVSRQIVGTSDEAVAGRIAAALQKLETEKALVIIGADGLDELSPVGINKIFEVTPETIKEYEINPADFGCTATADAIKGADAEGNAATFTQVFSEGLVNHAVAKTVCLNAAAGFYTFDKCPSIQDGYKMALHLVSNGAAWLKFLQYREITRRLAESM